MMYTFIADILCLIFEKQGIYMNALILWGFVKQFIEINVNKVSRIPSEWNELHVEKSKKHFGQAKRAENLKKMPFFHQL